MAQADEKANILIVDDRPDSRTALEAALGDLGQNLVLASSGEQALRHTLRMEFAAILLDVHMPGLDGFETATILRQRSSSRDTPIIFITGYTDELHISRGYSLGAVDYILAPVVPDVLRAKVGVFVELYRKNQQVRGQAASLERRAEQLQKLAAASVQINAARSIRPMLQTITDAARDVLGAHQAITLFFGEQGTESGRPLAVSSFSDRYAEWRDRPLDLAPVRRTIVARGRSATRMTEAELHAHPDWGIVSQLDMPPVRGGMLAAPLTDQEQRQLGVLYLTDAYDGCFSGEDEHILVQLAQIASIAIENILSADAREANRLKDEFLATLSHELRTPLNAMLGWIRLLRTSDPDEAMLATGLEVVERNVNAQTKLIEDLLDVSRITSGKLHLKKEPMLLQPVLEAAADAVRPTAEAKQARFIATLAAPNARLMGDADRLQQVIWNLLTNAIKFTPEQGRVHLSLEHEGGVACIRVEDSGEGIEPELLPYVFERFRQADSTSTRSHGGLGVGLALVHHIVQMHGGTVEAESGGEGRGSRFTVRLPLLETSESSDGEAVEADAATARMAAGGPMLDGLRVLVVDDEADTRELVGGVIEHYRGEVALAGSVAEAVEVLDRWRPHVLLSDIAMPEADGYALVKAVRRRPEPELRNMPAIAITAYARDLDRDQAMAAGFQQHLSKPVEPAVLLDALVRLAPEPSQEPASREGQENGCG